MPLAGAVEILIQDTRMAGFAEYDPRYLEGIRLFNAAEFFDAHEVWEDLWHDTAGLDRRFYQGLIQAAVAVYHASNGNARGARRLLESGSKHMAPFRPSHLGLDVVGFWESMASALADFVPDPPPIGAMLRAERLPCMALSIFPSSE